jgi:tRNA dimethylallyltransferase
MSTLSVVAIAGATGTGKTGAALHLARKFGAGVVNFDSRQVYRSVPLITAQPSPEERAVCPHRLYGFLDLTETMHASRFARLAHAALAETAAAGLLPVLVGGTGMYLKAILEGLSPIPDVDPEVRSRVLAECAEKGPNRLHAELAPVDPEAAARIHPNDSQRICRALEVYLSSGRPLTEWQRQKGDVPPYRVLKVGLHRELDELTVDLARRIDIMVEQGALEEIREAWEEVPDRNAPGFSGIGCPELLAHLHGECSLESAKAQWLKNTRAYAKRQRTWFKRDREIVWRSPRDPEGLKNLVGNWLDSGEARS